MKQISKQKRPVKKKITLPTVALALVSIWITLCCAANLEWDSAGNLITHSYSVWGDWSAHFSFISAFRERGIHWLSGDNPLFMGMPMQYPFLSHLLTAFYAWALHLNVVTATFSMSLILMLGLPFALRYFFDSLGLKPWTSFTSVVLFLFAGGFQCFDSAIGPKEFVTNQFDLGSIFTQFIIFELFPQRAFLFGVICFSLLAGRLIRGMKNNTLTLPQVSILGVLISLMTWLHVHTWISISSLILFSFIAPPVPFRKKILIFGASVAGLSAILLGYLLFRGHPSPEFSNTWDIWFPLWAQSPKANIAKAHDMNFFVFWIYNTGIFLPLALAGIYFTGCFSKGASYLKPLAYSGLTLFLVALFFNIQPYYYDNLKLFTYSFLLLAPFAALGLEKIAGLHKLLYPVAVALLAVQCASACLDLNSLRSHIQTTTFFNADEFTLAEEFKSIRKSPDSLVLIGSGHNHWVPCLAGNPIVMGYPGWLWSWGINYVSRERQVQAILMGKPEAQAAIQALHFDYVIVRKNEEIDRKPINHDFLKTQFQLLRDKSGWEIYSIRSPDTSVR